MGETKVDSTFARAIERAWAALPTVTSRWRGKLGDDKVYHAQPMVELVMTLDDAKALANGHVADSETQFRLRKVVTDAEAHLARLQPRT